LQIRKLDKIAIHEPNETHAGSHNLIRSHSPERTEPDDQDTSAFQAALAEFADWRKPCLP
jgi:hypothetical protein